MKSSKNPTTSSKLPYVSQCKYLPLDIWNHILSTLPAKTLLKLRCVCKSWCSIIDNPDFIHMHCQFSQVNFEDNNKLLVALECLGRSGEERSLLTIRDAQTLQEIDRIFSKSESHINCYIISCNGLLLVRQYVNHLKIELKLWNPSIRKSLILPTCPLNRPCWYLLGFAPDSQDYKVVAFLFDESPDEENGNKYIAVYTLRDRQWTVRNDPLNVSNLTNNRMSSLFYSLPNVVFLRGASYWLGNSDHRKYLIKFDFDKEKIAFLELPYSLEEMRSMRILFLFLFLLGGSLALFYISKVASSIWVLEQDDIKGSWIPWFSGQLSRDGYELFNKDYTGSKKILFRERDGGYFIYGNKAYDIVTGQVHELNKSMSSCLKLEKYFESLVLSKEHGARDLRSFP